MNGIFVRARDLYRGWLRLFRATRARIDQFRGELSKSSLMLSLRIRHALEVVNLNKIMKLVYAMPDFPSSDGSDRQRLELSILGASQGYGKINELLVRSGKSKVFEVTSRKDLFLEAEAIDFSRLLGLLFTSEGSDKSTPNAYEDIYAWIFQKLDYQVTLVGEIGLGTNNRDVVSHMGSNGRPGASLRAWREAFGEQCSVVGFDIDERVLFKEVGIDTYFLNQLNPKSFEIIEAAVGGSSFDLFIDDGLHAPIANLNFLLHGSKFVRSGGFMVVEDISPQSLDFWELVSNSLPESWNTWMIKANSSFVFVARVH